MLTAKQLLVKQTAEAFRGRSDMPLMATLQDITQEEASWRGNHSMPTIEQIVRHVAWAKSRFCQQGFGSAMVIADAQVNEEGDSADLSLDFPCGAAWGCSLVPGIGEAVKLLERSQQVLVGCLETCAEEDLEKPIPTHHGKSAAHFFWIMLMHDLYHAGQIRTRRTMYQAMARPSGKDR